MVVKKTLPPDMFDVSVLQTHNIENCGSLISIVCLIRVNGKTYRHEHYLC